MKPVKVLGDPDFIGTASNPLLASSLGPNLVEGRELNAPQGIALDTTVSPPIVYIADTGNNRVLAFQYSSQLVPGSFADLVLGQTDRFSNIPVGPGTGLTTGLKYPTGLAVDSAGNLYVADTGNNRVVRYPRPFFQPAGYQFPDLVIGQTSFSGGSSNQGGTTKASTLSLYPGAFQGRTGLAFDPAGNLWVADIGNNRVVRFPKATLQAGKNGPSADVVVGQPDLISSAPTFSATSTTSLVRPGGINFDGAGNLYVADAAARVLVFPPNPGPNASALRILGIVTQADQPIAPVNAISLASAPAVVAAGANLIVADGGNSRLMVYQSFPQWLPQSTQFSPIAVSVVGQTNFSSHSANQGNGDASASSLNTPVDMAVSGNELYVVDSGNNRVLVFPISPSGPQLTASRLIGQLDYPYTAPNLIEGKEFATAASSAAAASGSVVLDQSVSPPRVYVADTGNNRILGYANLNTLKNGQKPDLVIGQPDFYRNVINYPTGSGTTPNSKSLYGPTALLVDSAGNLYVADTFNSRVLRFPAPFASGVKALEAADLVIGQSGFNTIVTDPTQRTMSAPISLAFTADGFNAADANHNRVLLFAKPFSNGMSASKVLGQIDFVSTSGSANTQRLNSPRGIAVDPKDRPLVADFGNARVQVYAPASTLSNFATPSFSLTGFNQPLAIAMASSGQFWIADASANQLLHYTTVDQLPVVKYASDASVPANSPRSAAVDSYGNLVVADGINRILYFVPGLGIVNAANYLTGRPLAPGAFAAVFPAASSSATATTGTGSTTAPGPVIASGTGTATTLPLPTTLADTQVIVNGTPSTLFFVSPGQINLPLSMNLPTGGTVDVQVVRASTGQIYGGAEMQLSSASPGLFVLGGTQSGQVAALNEDGTVNSATNPALRGHVVQLFGTGQGQVSGAPPDGQAASGAVPTPLNPQVLLGSSFIPDANILYSGLAPSLVGVWQINIQIPTTASSNNYLPVTVFMNSIPSNNPSQPTQIVTTIAVK